jgi:hypothetical protein
VELFFSILARRLLKHGAFTSEADLAEQMVAFVETYNRRPSALRLGPDRQGAGRIDDAYSRFAGATTSRQPGRGGRRREKWATLGGAKYRFTMLTLRSRAWP